MAKSTGRGSDTARRRKARSNNSTNRAKTGARRGGSKSTPRAAKQPANHASTGRSAGERSGVSKLASFLRSPFLRKIAAAGLASAAAALIYKKSDPTREPHEGGVADDSTRSPIAPAVQATTRIAGSKDQAIRRADTAELAAATDVVSAGPVRTRKKRSDSGTKRPRKPVTSSASGADGRLLPTELPDTDTSTIALGAGSGAPDQLQDSPAEVETAAHPS